MRIAPADRGYDNNRPGAKAYLVGGDNILAGSWRCLPVSLALIDDYRYVCTYICRVFGDIALELSTSVYFRKCLIGPANVEQLPYHAEKIYPCYGFVVSISSCGQRLVSTKYVFGADAVENIAEFVSCDRWRHECWEKITYR